MLCRMHVCRRQEGSLFFRQSYKCVQLDPDYVESDFRSPVDPRWIPSNQSSTTSRHDKRFESLGKWNFVSAWRLWRRYVRLPSLFDRDDLSNGNRKPTDLFFFLSFFILFFFIYPHVLFRIRKFSLIRRHILVG